MGKIEFDAAAASAVIRAATSAEDELRAQSGPRRSAVEDAAADFAGVYADRFTGSASVESADRGKLASVLDDLVGQIREAESAAQAEQERLDALEAWNGSERERQRVAAMSFIDTSTLPPAAIRAPKPSELATRPPTIHAAFAPRERTRSGGGTGGSRSSADPARLHAFSTVSRAKDAAVEEKAATLASAWKAFTVSCSWVQIDGCTFVTGFDRFLEENRADAAWIDRIAGQAEVAKPIIEHWGGDEWAAVGRGLSTDHHQDPTAPEFGATSFGADGAPGLKPVRDHGVHTWYGGGYLDKDTQSLQNVAYATTGQPERLTK